MPIKKAQTPTATATAEAKPSDDDVLISTTYVPQGAYVVIAMDENVDNQVVLFAPSGAESIGDRKVKVIARDLTAADALRRVADLVEEALSKVPKSSNGPVAKVPVKAAPAAKRGGAGPQKTADPAAPWGRLADGTPKQKPGRRAATAGTSAPAPAPAKKVAVAKKAPAGNGATKKAGVAKRPSVAKK